MKARRLCPVSRRTDRGSHSPGTAIPRLGSKGFDLYVKVIGSENLLRLTRQPSPDWIASAWSPDGTQIAFHRISGSDAGLYVVPALGGPERKLRAPRESSIELAH